MSRRFAAIMIRGKITYYMAIISIVSSLIISGCVSEQPKSTPAQTTTPAAVQTAASVPTQQPGINVEILNMPSTATAGKSFEISWRVNSPQEKSISHTAIHYGPESKAEPVTITSYSDETPVITGETPADFKANLSINRTGTTYFRAHATIEGVDYWSSEKSITVYVAPSIRVKSIPNRVVENTNFTIKYEVSGGITGKISKTEIIWDFKKGNATVTDYFHSTSAMTGKTPGEFSGLLKVPQTSTIYFRAHAIVDGIEIFSDEFQITIYPEYTTGY